MFNKIGLKMFLFLTLILSIKMVTATEVDYHEQLRRIMRASNYFDNNIKSINYYYGEMVTINFTDGKKVNVGLIDRWRTENIDGVDCETPTHDIYFAVEKDGYGFFTRNDLELLRDSGPVGRSFLDLATRLEFIKNRESNKVFPTYINKKTAPNFCEVHNLAKRRWEQCFPFCGLI